MALKYIVCVYGYVFMKFIIIYNDYDNNDMIIDF